MVADIAGSMSRGEPVSLRRPTAVRPWQHVLEPLGGYLTLAARLIGPDREQYCDAWNFGPLPEDDATVGALTDQILHEWGTGAWIDGSRPDDLPEAGVLRLSIEHTMSCLGWRPRWRLQEAVRRTVGWYRKFDADHASARAACLADIEAYMEDPGPHLISDPPLAPASDGSEL
jgi:CDP-glucose 4,6-dehydratase